MKFKKLTIFLFLISFLFATKNSNAVGVAAGAEFNLIDNIIAPKKTDLLLEDHIFVGANAFSNYYGGNTINYNYGLKGTLGYKVMGALAYGLGGVQHAGFSSNKTDNFKSNTSPIYGIGIGYNFPLLNLGVRLENTYFSLDKKDGGKDNFNFVDLGLIFVF